MRSTFTGRLGLTDCRFHSANKCIVMEGGGRLDLVAPFFQDWTTNAVRIDAGTVSWVGGTAKIGSPTPLVVITGVPWVTVSGVLFEYEEHVVWDTSGIGANCTFNDTGNGYATSPKLLTPALGSGWVALGSGAAAVGYVKEDRFVRFQGSIKNGATGSITLFTLPIGYRPPTHRFFSVPNDVGVGSVFVQSDGQVRLTTTNNVSVGLDGVRFPTR
jgi:hypothetical protein